jgi:F-type H+-transporting ATPase subunit b
MKLVTPDIGLLFWMLLMFGVVLFILTKFAWKPILKALKDREQSIDEALKSADKAKEDMEKLQADNEKILQEARSERDDIIKDAKDVRQKMIDEARKEASVETQRLLEAARAAIEGEKDSAINEIREKIAEMSLDIAEKILREKLSDSKEQKDLIDRLIKEIKLN